MSAESEHAALRSVDHQAQPLGGGEIAEIATQFFEQGCQREFREFELDGAGFQFADVEQRVDEPRHRIDGGLLLPQYILAVGIVDHPSQGATQQAERLQRLPQVVAGRGQKPALGKIGVVGLTPRVA